MDDFEKYLNSQLSNDEDFKNEWENSEIEYELTKTLISLRNQENLTQQQLAERTGLRQSNISRIENGSVVPSLTTLETIAHGLGKKLKIEFV
ncbi:helix-turn-helix domain-containing protein [Ruminococcus sp.]|uniref:helix-turn-helix domain-containing protein n=1 Tax=Ruminococcus sp. TaxID=41978 RepID=UPI00386553C9